VSRTPEQDPYADLEIYIIEINPLAEFAGTGLMDAFACFNLFLGLFSWENEEDVKTMMGEKEFEFRMQEKILENPFVVVEEKWHRFLSKKN